MNFAVLSGVRPRIEEMPLADAAAHEEVIEYTDANPYLAPPEPVGRGQTCKECMEVRHPTGALPRRCDLNRCRRLYHCLCAGYLFELHPDADFFCRACLKGMQVTHAAVEQASAEIVALPSVLAAAKMAVRAMDPDGECLTRAVAAGTDDVPGDARVLMQQLGEALRRLLTFTTTALAPSESRDMAYWRSIFAGYVQADPSFLKEVDKASRKLAEGKSTLGNGWNSAATDLAPHVLPALTGRPLHVFTFTLRLRGFGPTPQVFDVVALPGVAPPPPSPDPVLLLRTKVGIKLDHYDLLVRL